MSDLATIFSTIFADVTDKRRLSAAYLDARGQLESAYSARKTELTRPVGRPKATPRTFTMLDLYLYGRTMGGDMESNHSTTELLTVANLADFAAPMLAWAARHDMPYYGEASDVVRALERFAYSLPKNGRHGTFIFWLNKNWGLEATITRSDTPPQEPYGDYAAA